jgi:hypothetical protein
MLALHHGQNELTSELLKQNASIRHTGPNGWIAIDYLLQGFYKNTLLKYNQMATTQTLRQFWHLIKPSGVVMELDRLQLHLGGHSMLFFLLILMRTMQEMMPEKIKVTYPNDKFVVVGAFNMDDFERLTSVLPDDMLPPYRKNRSYINSVLAGNEISRHAHPGCKMTFTRVKRGMYILNPDIKWKGEK